MLPTVLLGNMVGKYRFDDGLQPGMNLGVGGDEMWCGQAIGLGSGVGDDCAGFCGDEHTGGRIPRTERELPIPIEAAAGDPTDIESSAADPAEAVDPSQHGPNHVCVDGAVLVSVIWEPRPTTAR